MPQRIVCTTTESVDILYRLGAGDLIVGVSGYTTRPPEARRKPKVGAYTSVNLEKILSLKPDLVVAFSDLQADITRDLVKAGLTVFVLNQRSLEGIFEAILMLGALIARTDAAQKLIDETRAEIETIEQQAQRLSKRPRVYFEEWHDPLITGIAWVGELIERAGGVDVFADIKGHSAKERIVSADEVLRRNPDLIVASWCGKKVNRQTIYNRPGWEAMAAIKHKRVYEIKSVDILQPGPAVLEGLKQLHQIIQKEFA
ncbi:MAG: cobalamin-binding protein [Chloroflexi bacterium]|nr:cobalamin-binding protein [Chloroflexota bacterium]